MVYGLFGLDGGYLCGLIWLEGERRNLRLLEGLELIFECGMDGRWLGGGNFRGLGALLHKDKISELIGFR